MIMIRETSTETDGEEDREPIRFDAILHPHASLTPRGFFLLMTAVGMVSFCAGTAFVLIGAWPVFGFFGLDALLVYAAFKLNYRDARRYETVRLTESALMVERVAPSGRRERWNFQPYWLQVEIDDSETPRRALTLRSHGRMVEIGSFLSPEEKIDLANALRAELAKLRSPAIEAALGGSEAEG
jgi:uncharacterized membrane protein